MALASDDDPDLGIEPNYFWHFDMLLDDERNQLYKKAIERALRHVALQRQRQWPRGWLQQL